MLVCIKDWELGQQRAQHTVEDQELEDYFKNLWLDEDLNASAGWVLVLLLLESGDQDAAAGWVLSVFVSLRLLECLWPWVWLFVRVRVNIWTLVCNNFEHLNFKISWPYSFFLSKVSHEVWVLPRKVYNEATLHKQLKIWSSCLSYLIYELWMWDCYSCIELRFL